MQKDDNDDNEEEGFGSFAKTGIGWWGLIHYAVEWDLRAQGVLCMYRYSHYTTLGLYSKVYTLNGVGVIGSCSGPWGMGEDWASWLLSLLNHKLSNYIIPYLLHWSPARKFQAWTPKMEKGMWPVATVLYSCLPSRQDPLPNPDVIGFTMLNEAQKKKTQMITLTRTPGWNSWSVLSLSCAITCDCLYCFIASHLPSPFICHSPLHCVLSATQKGECHLQLP